MWNLDDTTKYTKIHAFTLPKAFTYADTRAGHTDKEKREYIRREAEKDFPINIFRIESWAFRVFVKKSSKRLFDIENVPKLIVDAFCKRQIHKDNSKYEKLGLNDDDRIDYARIIEIGGIRTQYEDSTKIEIFGFKQVN